MKHCLLIILLFSIACNNKVKQEKEAFSEPDASVALYVLGTVQDAGSPHIDCQKECCSVLFKNPDPDRKVVALGLVDHENGKSFLFEATPDIPTQLRLLRDFSGNENDIPDGIFLTHAHIGHYTGLMYLGREAKGANQVPVYAMPKMKSFLETNGPWNQLVTLNNINLQQIQDETPLQLTSNITVVPFSVPHRDEYSETVGYKIMGPNKSVLFIPDIDKWHKWKKNIVEEIKKVDFAFLDASFFDEKEINNRNVSEIPHPFVIESMKLFDELSDEEKAKVHFIHFNHTNPLLKPKSSEFSSVLIQGHKVAKFRQKFAL
ncbi:MBL fold metallo-hydrolase [Flagellimonas pacifica]|uniref:Pyrroloquinoline quinone biosynthesis protein B n=1 Tax=Flagellimonas pacifica TaxID=1247520 RepID=A0A285MYS4_9FLAO|nr:MBL fold metallo-hydrolase [Allomuricauda parva]SNZ01823.1 pyrroloquinoline quinone biosynthesis protein B [Allomuricauda parva]